MLFLLAVQIVILVTTFLRLVQTFAPSNILTARVRASRPSFRIAVGLTALALVLVSGVHGLGIAIENGAPGWLNLVVLVLLWDVFKVFLLACCTLVRCIARAIREWKSTWRDALPAAAQASTDHSCR